MTSDHEIEIEHDEKILVTSGQVYRIGFDHHSSPGHLVPVDEVPEEYWQRFPDDDDGDHRDRRDHRERQLPDFDQDALRTAQRRLSHLEDSIYDNMGYVPDWLTAARSAVRHAAALTEENDEQ